jgi:NADH dehydrogenase/NADH:ubiquinone oxidoreductase subunit G
LEYIEISINKQLYVVKENLSIIETCKFTGIEIPRFCYQEGLSIAGNCRMCLVYLELSDKLVIACLTDIESEIIISTDNLIIRKARENIIETLLLNHPLDCPICDQAGECDLQDQAQIYGSNHNKMYVKRRGVEDKNFNFLIKTIMTRCIHCTRCVRFINEILKIESFSTLMRGSNTEISSYTETKLKSDLTGNLIDLCPVGALTSRTQAFITRPWELKSLESVDLTDSLCSSIFINFKESEIIRVLPKSSKKNNNLISDKARFSFDALYANRAMDYDSKKKKWISKVIRLFKKKFVFYKKEQNITIVVNEQLDLKQINKLKFIASTNNYIKIRNVVRYNEFKNLNLLINDSLLEFDKEKSCCAIILGCNSKSENEIINSKITIKSNLQDYLVYATKHKYAVSNNTLDINLNNKETFFIFEGKNNILCKLLIKKKKSHFFISDDFKKRYFNTLLLKTYLKKINNNLNNIFTNSFSNTETIFFLGIKSINYRDFDLSSLIVCINLNENITLKKTTYKIKNRLIWLSSHCSSLTEKKNIIPFLSNYFEKKGMYLNLEQEFQKAHQFLKTGSDFSFENIFLKKKIRVYFKYLNFTVENKLNKKSNHRELLFSFLNKVKTMQNIIISYPKKNCFQDISKKDLFLSNSYSLLNKYLEQKFDSY